MYPLFQAPCRSLGTPLPGLVLLALLGCYGAARAQLSGAYTINPSGSGSTNYTTIENAITALNTSGVSGAVTFRITGGTITPPTGAYVLPTIASMSATNSVTFKPASGATVTMDVTLGSPIFTISGKYYILDGSNSIGGTSRDWTITNRNTNHAIIKFVTGGQFTTIKNLNLRGSATSATIGIIWFSTSSAAGGNSGNRITNNLIGDPGGIIRATTGIYMLGTATRRNTANIIERNEIVNIGTGSTTAYGFHISTNNDSTKIFGNSIHNSVMTGTSGAVYGIYYANASSVNDSIAYNRIWSLNSGLSTSNQYGIDVSIKSATSAMVIHDNMVSLSASGGTLYGIYNSEPCPITIDYNSIHIGGTTGAATSSFGIGNEASGATMLVRNNAIVNVRTGTGSGSTVNAAIYSVSGATFASNYNVIHAVGTGTAVGLFNTTSYSTLAGWQGATIQDANSLALNPQFIDPVNGDLHISTSLPTPVEGNGTPVTGLTLDGDAQIRNTSTPDIGADEGDFNGGGIGLIYPNGGEQIPVNYQLPVQFTTNRPMGIRIKISINNGVTWTLGGLLDASITGTNTVIITTPDTVSNVVLMRVVSQRNQFEADTSDRILSLVRPVLTLLAPNGGETWIAGDTNRITWTSEFVPPTLSVLLEYSTNGGGAWLPIASGLVTSNLPGTNSFNWIIPNTTSTNAMVRLRIPGSKAMDISDAIFTITGMIVVMPNGGERIFTGERYTIRWSSVTSNYVRLEYSTDGGETWTTIIDRVPAYLGSYDWSVPNIETNNALVRVTDIVHHQYSDLSDSRFSILEGELTLLFPNGGEKFELSDPITVRWASRNTTTLRLEYSSDNGATWQLINDAVPAADDNITFTPAALPTKLALVRLVDVNRPQIQDHSDAPFEIRAAKSIVVFAPGEGDELVRGTSAWIYWTANRLTSVMIQYSSNGGESWITIDPNIPASQGSYQWNVANQLTNNARIQILEVGGATIGQSGRFSLVDLAAPSMQSIVVVRPNGGERFTVGTVEKIMWTESDITAAEVKLEYSTDDGGTWTQIAMVNRDVKSYDWTVADVPSTEVLIRVSAEATSDVSDAVFTIVPAVVKTVNLISPDGGEVWSEGDVHAVTWTSTGLAGSDNVRIEYSTDGGVSWADVIGSTSATSGTYNWTIPKEETITAKVQLTLAGDASVRDKSQRDFTIRKRTLGAVAVDASGEEVLRLNANSPNPFATETSLRWVQAKGGEVRVRIHDGSGRLVRQMEVGHREGGEQRLALVAGELASGVYRYEVQVGATVARGMMVIVR